MSGSDAIGSFPVAAEDDSGSGVDPNTFYATPIDTAEAWGSPALNGTISPSSIDSAEAWGEPWFAELTFYEPASVGEAGLKFRKLV